MIKSIIMGLLLQPPVYTINSGQATLTINQTGAGAYGIGIQLNGSTTYYEQNNPLAVEIVNTGGAASWLTAPYASVQDMGGGVYQCSGAVTTPNGSVFQFNDTYRSYNNSSTFTVSRSVTVTVANASDAGFSTRLAFQRNTTSAMSDYDFFAPGVWYRDNADVADYALATDLSDNYYWFREDRMPLPVFMVREKASGATFSVFHKDPDGSTFKEEDGLNRVIDGRMKFASMGMQNNTQPLIGMLYPGTEGERTGIYGMSATKRWAYRSHPVTLNYTQQYSMALRLTQESDFPSALKNTWASYYNVNNPTLYTCNLTQVYQDQIAILNRYWQSINNAPGVPFRVQLDGNLTSQNDYNYDMGFVGMQLPNAALLIREGINTGNTALKQRGEQMAEWWASNASLNNGCLRTWYDPYPQTWRTYETYMRVVGDGMSGLLWAWNFEKKNGTDKANWLNVCTKAGNWLASIQNSGGSLPRAIDYTNNTVKYADKTNTSHIIPFLVDLYKVTGANLYLQTALKAGNYIYSDVHQHYRYVGGTPDNPNVPDKEAASMALRAFLALYDLDGDSKWLNAALQSAYYYATWVYSWNVPIPQDDNNTTYPKNRSVTGLSIIATGNNGADTYAAIDAFNFYRLYLYSSDTSLLKTARLLLQNTKQAVNWDRNDPIPGYGDPGILGEAMTVMIPRGHGVNYYLPWQTYNLMEPLVLMKDVFGAYDINTAEQLSLSDRQTKNNQFSATRNFVRLATEPENIISGAVYRVTGKQSGKVMEVEGASSVNGANISQNQWANTTNQQWTITRTDGGYYSIRAVHSGQAADVVASSTADGANITQWPYYGGTNQQWQICDAGDSSFRIVNRNSGKAMDVAGFSLADHGNIQQFTYNQTDNQKWKLQLLNPPSIVSGSVYRITNKNSNKVMDVEAASQQNGANISQYQWMHTDNQRWTVTDVGGGYYKICAVHSGQAVDVVASSTADGANITQWPYYGGTNQQWQIISAGNGYYRIVNRNSGKVVDVAGASTANTANIYQQTWTGADSQLWKFEVSDDAAGRTADTTHQKAGNTPGLNVYPNPASDQLYIRWDGFRSGKALVAVYSEDGKLVLTQRVGKMDVLPLNVCNFRPGVYFLVMKNGVDKASAKAVVSR